MNNVFVKPVLIDGQPAIVRDPVTRAPLKATGEWKPQNQFWTRRIDQSDVIDITAEQTAVQAAPAKDAPTKSPGPSPMPERANK